jgi:GH24 family phage-related lysozyme (muramidase)
MISLSETTKKLDKEDGEKIIPPMMNNTFFGNEKKEKDIFKKVSVISKKTFLIGISINKIFDKLISVLTASDELDQLELSSPNVSRTKSEVRKAPSLKPDNSLGGLGFGLIVAAILAAVGYKILQLVTEKLITPMVDGITSLSNKIIDAYSSAAIAFISTVTSSMEAAVNSATFALNTITDSIYSLEIGIQKAYRSVVGTTEETEERIDSLEKQKISKRDETTAKGESIKKTIQEEEISLVSAVSDTSQEIKDTITRTGQSIKDTVYIPPISKVLTSFGGIPGAIAPSNIPGGGPGVVDSSAGISAGNTSADMNTVDMIKSFEGFTPTAMWDVKQYSIGYGTKANSPNETITKQEAERRLINAITPIANKVESLNRQGNYNWNENQKGALISFGYNLGPGALNQLTANATRDNETIAQKMPEYNKADGETLPGLVRRRLIERQKFLMNMNKDKVYVVDNRKPPVNSGKGNPKAQQRQRVSSYLGNFGDYFGTGDTTGIPNYA